MRVFVVDGSIGPNSRRVWQDQNVIPLGSGQEQANQVQLTLGQVGLRFELLQCSLVLYREYEHRCGSIELRIRKHFLKYRTHSLKLPSHPAALLLAGVSDDEEVWRVYLQPRVSLRARGGSAGGKKGDEEGDPFEHSSASKTYTAQLGTSKENFDATPNLLFRDYAQ